MIPIPDQWLPSYQCSECGRRYGHICEGAEKRRNLWYLILSRLGSEELDRRIQKREQARLYNRKYPFDSTTTKVSEEVLEWQADNKPSPDELVMMGQARDDYLAKLTPSQQDIALLLEQGYKPKEIAAMRGDKNSGAVRWQKHNIKERLTPE